MRFITCIIINVPNFLHELQVHALITVSYNSIMGNLDLKEAYFIVAVNYTFSKNISKYNILCIISVYLWLKYRNFVLKKIKKM